MGRPSGLAYSSCNQPGGIARGLFTEKQYHECTAYIQKHFQALGSEVDLWLHAPSHPEGEVPVYRKASVLRKPAAGMILQAAQMRRIHLSASVMIGDKDSDDLELVALHSYFLKGKYPLSGAKNQIFESYEEMLKKLKGEHSF